MNLTISFQGLPEFRERVLQICDATRQEAAAALYQEIDGQTANGLLIVACKLKIEIAETKLADFAPLVAKYKTYEHDRSLNDDQRADVRDKLRQLDEKVAAQQAELATEKKRLADLEKAGETS